MAWLFDQCPADYRGYEVLRRQPDGSYATLPGYTSVLSKVNGLFQLREATGEVTAVRADGLLDYLQDANGNRIRAGYDGNQLTSLTHSGGGALTARMSAFASGSAQTRYHGVRYGSASMEAFVSIGFGSWRTVAR